MTLEIIKYTDFDWSVLEKVAPYSIFSEAKTLKVITQIFESSYSFVVYSRDLQSASAILPISIQNEIIMPVGYYGDNDMFDFAPLSFNDPNDFIELISELKVWAETQNLRINLREIPSFIANQIQRDKFKVALDAIIPITNIDRNIQAKEGKPIFKKKHRKEMRRKLNRLTAEHINFRVEKEAVKTTELMDKFLDFFSNSAKTEKQSFIKSKSGEFFKLFLAFEELKFSTMYFNDKLVSILVYFENNTKWLIDKDGRKIVYLYNMASDTEYYDYSPGLIHINSMIMDVIKQGYDEFNFLRGEERYKFEIGANACRWNVKLGYET